MISERSFPEAFANQVLLVLICKIKGRLVDLAIRTVWVENTMVFKNKAVPMKYIAFFCAESIDV